MANINSNFFISSCLFFNLFLQWHYWNRGGLILLAFMPHVVIQLLFHSWFLQFWNNLWRAILTRDYMLNLAFFEVYTCTGISMLFVVSLSAPILQISIGIFFFIQCLEKFRNYLNAIYSLAQLYQ